MFKINKHPLHGPSPRKKQYSTKGEVLDGSGQVCNMRSSIVINVRMLLHAKAEVIHMFILLRIPI